MARNKVQFQKGISEAQFDELYGTEALCHAALLPGAGLTASNVQIATAASIASSSGAGGLCTSAMFAARCRCAYGSRPCIC